MKTMYDAVTAQNIPTNAAVVGGYVEGNYTWSQADWDRFPNAIKKTIAIWSADADILDIERGDATPDMAPDWSRRQIARGVRPTLYSNLSTWPLVVAAINGSGLQGQVDYWIADYTQQEHIIGGTVATQWCGDCNGVDISLVQDAWVGETPVSTLRPVGSGEFGPVSLAIHPGG